MKLRQLNRMVLKAHMYMGAGTAAGCILAHLINIRHDLLFGIGVGLLFSLYKYYICIIILQSEYQRLKNKQNNEPKDLS